MQIRIVLSKEIERLQADIEPPGIGFVIGERLRRRAIHVQREQSNQNIRWPRADTNYLQRKSDPGLASDNYIPRRILYHLEMVLSDVDIRRYLAEGKIKITPSLPPEQFGSCSVDFRLGDEFSVFEHSRHALIDLKEKTAIQDLMRTIKVVEGEPFILQPREFALAITQETLELDDDVLGRLEGRSSLGRIGIIVHGTAGLFDPGWRGQATLELSNLGVMPVALPSRHENPIYTTLAAPTARRVFPTHKKGGNKYADQSHPVATRLAMRTTSQKLFYNVIV